MKESHQLLHGYKVSYGIIIQLYLEDKPVDDIKKVVSFCEELGLTPSLAGLGLPFNWEILKQVARMLLMIL